MGILLKNERDLLIGALQEAIVTVDNFDRLADLLGYIPDNIKPGQGISSRLEALVDNVDRDGWVRLNRLLDFPDHLIEWKGSVPLRGALELVRKGYQERQNVSLANLALQNPFEACLLDQGRPFIDREPFREFLMDINNENGSRFMVVNGPPGIGKSHSYYLIQSLAPQCGFNLSYVELKSGKRAGFHAIDLVKKIKRDLLLPDPGRILEQQASVEARWAEELGGWLEEAIKSSGKVCWIVLDGFDFADLPEDTRQVVDGLIEAVDKTMENARLVFLDYSTEKLPTSVRFFAHEENLQEVSQDQLEKFLVKLCEYKKIQPDGDKVKIAAGQLLANLPSNEEKHMLEIMFRIMQTVPKLALLGVRNEP